MLTLSVICCSSRAQYQAHPVGTRLRNPAYAETLRRVAALGVDGFWRNGAAERLVAAAQRGAHASLMTADDVKRYRAVEREPLCVPLRVWRSAEARLEPLVADGLAAIENGHLVATEAGRRFVRHIAAAFDAHLGAQAITARHSRAV